MEKRFSQHIQKFLQDDDVILLAISGGLDSIVLFHLLHKLDFEVVLAHCNFQLRGAESDADAKFVQNLAQSKGIRCFVKTFDTHKYAESNGLNTQLAARKLRYDWFEQLRQDQDCQYIVTAHHADDDLETFLINLSRGTGIKGLLGIPEKNGNIIRPLLVFSRDEILQYANKHQLKWREDSSNATDNYLRNRIRHHVLPKLKELHPQFLENFKNTQDFMNQSVIFIEEQIVTLKEQIFSFKDEMIYIDLEKMSSLKNLDFLLHQIFYPYGFSNVSELKKMMKATSGKQLISDTHRLLKDRNIWILKHRVVNQSSSFLLKKTDKIVEKPLSLVFENVIAYTSNTAQTIFVDADLLEYPLKIRPWQSGDVFYPIGLNQKKKVSKFFKDEKLSIFEKEDQWLLVSGEKIVWIIGRRADNRFRVTSKTVNILKITLK
ncbi:tRNA lysidine(34) synthetase TilS [Capnocytophaga canimorsus]|uniref:tRNA lysidine(34) synthetase TilS n=1 Tax=Capnocytophaga canimorsus TaxID=28188 RepID=UPI000BB1B6E0|nr:tRNA lysidine(34) synthetase TilS [Capnocytophaga canimorsus]ATA76519.1 tRNA lysidine(34) synthetase TilS [Capnocytophaga canimorsus]PJI77280.1 tRNA(Ile)-lysidine synthase [Capnocytophaga canimorsus]STA71677.1 tRNA(Ile)-lysidine synthase [Capnocytophaga canimorsus]